MKGPLPANSSFSPYCWNDRLTSRYIGNPRIAASTSRAGASRVYGTSGASRRRRGGGGAAGGGWCARRGQSPGAPPERFYDPELRTSVIRVLASLVASATDERSVKIETSMSGRMLAASTLAQLGEVGVKRLFLAVASNTDRYGSSACRSSRVVELGMTPPTVAIWVWNLFPDSSFTHSRARSWFLDLAAMPRSDPPRNTGAVWPLVRLGSGAAARSFSSLGLPCLGSRMTPFS